MDSVCVPTVECEGEEFIADGSVAWIFCEVVELLRIAGEVVELERLAKVGAELEAVTADHTTRSDRTVPFIFRENDTVAVGDVTAE